MSSRLGQPWLISSICISIVCIRLFFLPWKSVHLMQIHSAITQRLKWLEVDVPGCRGRRAPCPVPGTQATPDGFHHASPRALLKLGASGRLQILLSVPSGNNCSAYKFNAIVIEKFPKIEGRSGDWRIFNQLVYVGGKQKTQREEGRSVTDSQASFYSCRFVSCSNQRGKLIKYGFQVSFKSYL